MAQKDKNSFLHHAPLRPEREGKLDQRGVTEPDCHSLYPCVYAMAHSEKPVPLQRSTGPCSATRAETITHSYLPPSPGAGRRRPRGIGRSSRLVELYSLRILTLRLIVTLIMFITSTKVLMVTLTACLHKRELK